ncbi:MAG TPA: hypothetical protein VGR73_06485 [Bryobacteraceae bacterium]|nr:hypothetical protein [Bryobacteraceae bacterium]
MPERSGTSSPVSERSNFTFSSFDDDFFFFNLGPFKIRGARKPACNANSAKAFPDGSRQLIGSIHSIGRWGMLPDVRFRPALGLSGPSFSDFILYCYSHYSFDRIGGFH